MSTHELRHSFSSIQMFDNCPKRYYHQRVAKDVTDPGSEASIYGERVHKSFEDRLREGIALPDDLKKHEPLCAAMVDLGGDLTPELELVINKSYVPTGWWDEDAWLRSKLDVMIELEDKGVIFDWKTGKRKPDFFQLELSAMQAFIRYPKMNTISTAFVWLRDEAIDKETYRRSQLEGMIKKFEGKVERIEEALNLGVWQPKPGPLCNWCPAKNICQYADLRRRR